MTAIDREHIIDVLSRLEVSVMDGDRSSASVLEYPEAVADAVIEAIGELPEEPEAPPRTVTFDLSDPDVRHVLTQALEDYADRQQDMAVIRDNPEQRLTWAALAKTMREQAEAAGS